MYLQDAARWRRLTPLASRKSPSETGWQPSRVLCITAPLILALLTQAAPTSDDEDCVSCNSEPIGQGFVKLVALGRYNA